MTVTSEQSDTWLGERRALLRALTERLREQRPKVDFAYSETDASHVSVYQITCFPASRFSEDSIDLLLLVARVPRPPRAAAVVAKNFPTGGYYDSAPRDIRSPEKWPRASQKDGDVIDSRLPELVEYLIALIDGRKSIASAQPLPGSFQRWYDRRS